MSKDYTKSALLANKLITKFGQTVNIVRNEDADADPSKPWEGQDDSETLYPAKGVLLQLGKNDIAMLPEGTAVETASLMYLDAVVLTVEPVVGDIVRTSTEDWTIAKLSPLKPATVNVMYECIVSK